MKTVRIAAAQTVEFKEDIEAALDCVTDIAARAESEDASLLCFPESFLQGYLTDETLARRNALDLSSPAFEAVLNRLPKAGPMIVIGLTEVEEGRLFNTAIVVDRGILIGRYRKVHLLSGEHIFDAGSDSHVFEVDGLRFGINICYDTNFPEAARKVADLGASLIVCPANNMHHRKYAHRARHGCPKSNRGGRGSTAFGKNRIVNLRYSLPHVKPENRVQQFVLTGTDDDFAARAFEDIGAWILGRNMFGPVRGPWQ
jgi:predicted amidohydrolase